MTRVYISIGSNVDRESNVSSGVDALREHYGELTISSIYESPAVGFDGERIMFSFAFNWKSSISSFLFCLLKNHSVPLIEASAAEGMAAHKYPGPVIIFTIKRKAEVETVNMVDNFVNLLFLNNFFNNLNAPSVKAGYCSISDFCINLSFLET